MTRRPGARRLEAVGAAVVALALVAGCTLGGDESREPARTPAPQQEPTASPSAPTEPGGAPPTSGARPEVPALRTFEVAPEGDDRASGAPGEPFATLGHALGELRAGDKLVVRGGDYREDVDLRVSPGRADAPVQVEAAPGERPVLHGLLWLEDPSWWQVRGLNVTWNPENDTDQHMVKLTGGDDWVLADAELWGAHAYAALLVAGEPRRFLLTGLYVHDTVPSNDTNQDHLVYLNCGTGGGVLERSILVRSPNGRAVKIGPPDGDGDPVENITIRYNTMVDNQGPSNVQLSRKTSGVVIERNIMDGSGDGQASVTAFKLTGDGNRVTDNIFWRSAAPLEAGVDGLVDAGGNRVLDPRLSGDSGARPYEPAAPRARAYGRWAP
jgi:hypothetical protein